MTPILHLFCVLTHSRILFPLTFNFRAKYYKTNPAMFSVSMGRNNELLILLHEVKKRFNPYLRHICLFHVKMSYKIIRKITPLPF